jgi:hypothetical protein
MFLHYDYTYHVHESEKRLIILPINMVFASGLQNVTMLTAKSLLLPWYLLSLRNNNLIFSYIFKQFIFLLAHFLMWYFLCSWIIIHTQRHIHVFSWNT